MVHKVQKFFTGYLSDPDADGEYMWLKYSAGSPIQQRTKNTSDYDENEVTGQRKMYCAAEKGMWCIKELSNWIETLGAEEKHAVLTLSNVTYLCTSLIIYRQTNSPDAAFLRWRR